MTDATEPDEAAVRAAIREHVIRCRVERGYGEGNDEAFASTDATFLLTALDKARIDLPAALDEITRLRAALDEARADAAAANGALEAAPEVLRLAEMSDQVGVWMARAEAAESALAAVRALADRIEREGVTCECGHYVGDAHNSLGCYAVVTYSPLVRCDCTKTDNQDEDAIVANAIRAAALATPTTTDEGDDRG